MEPTPAASRHDPFAALRVPAFARYTAGALLWSLGNQVRTVTVGWELYERTREPLALGYVGLVLALPVIVLALPAGAVADRFSRRGVLAACVAGLAACAAGLAWASAVEAPLWVFYALLLGTGIFSAFARPASQALVPGLVPITLFPNAVKWSSIRWQTAATAGPLVGGLLLVAFGQAAPLYLVDAGLHVAFLVLLATVRPLAPTRAREPVSWRSMLEGARFVRRQPLVLSALTLDMVAVLFGGATALLPVYARDVLGGGPDVLGWLRAAPAVGAVVMALALAYAPPMRHAGRAILWSVGGFGAATVVFGLSTSLPVSLAALFALGAFDNVSVVVRSTLVQLLTPDAMRGRVSAVNAVFIGTSNEIGDLESGVAAHLVGPVAAVASGGVITMATALVAMAIWPQLRKLGRLEDARPVEA